MRKRCQDCGGPFVSRDEPYCRRCAEERAIEKMEDDLRRDELAQITTWAQRILARDPLILDTETTGLDGYIVQVAVIDSQGNALIDTLVNPQAEIEDGAAAIHGITAAMAADAPTFAQLHEQLHAILKGRTVCVYNLDFDRGILLNERHRLGHRPGLRVMYGALWEDVMLPYSTYIGEVRYDDSYRWQRLPGGDHTALGDCRATLAVLREMAARETPT